MEKYFGNSYRGDPGVPHSDPDRFVNIWIGSAAFSALTWINPYMWQLSNQFNWHDKAMLYEQYHWKKALEKKQPYKFLWKYETRTTSTGQSTFLRLPVAIWILIVLNFLPKECLILILSPSLLSHRLPPKKIEGKLCGLINLFLDIWIS